MPGGQRRNADFTPPPRVASEFWQAATLAGPRRRAPPSANGWGGATPANALIDTGAILALLDRTDRWHDPCVNAFRQLRLPLLTSGAV
ncbi:MAG TPA: hypothetical protein VI455_03175, partial [Terriglobia bacterium]